MRARNLRELTLMFIVAALPTVVGEIAPLNTKRRGVATSPCWRTASVVGSSSYQRTSERPRRGRAPCAASTAPAARRLGRCPRPLESRRVSRVSSRWRLSGWVAAGGTSYSGTSIFPVGIRTGVPGVPVTSHTIIWWPGTPTAGAISRGPPTGAGCCWLGATPISGFSCSRPRWPRSRPSRMSRSSSIPAGLAPRSFPAWAGSAKPIVSLPEIGRFSYRCDRAGLTRTRVATSPALRAYSSPRRAGRRPGRN